MDPRAVRSGVGARVGDRRGGLRGEQGQHLLVLVGERLPVCLVGEEEAADVDAAVAHRRALEGAGERRGRLDAERADVAREVVDPLVETAAAQQARQQENSARADSLILSTMHVEVAGPDATLAFRWLSEYSGPRCELRDPTTGETDTISLATSAVVRGDAEAIGSVHGITLLSETGKHVGVDRTSLGAWMEHGSFGLFNDRAIGEEIEATYLYALALGDLTGRPPAGSATWLGIMVGTPTAGDDEGDRLVGTAALNYDMDAGALDAAFSGI